MDFDAAPQPIADDDATIRSAVAAVDVDVFPLLGAVAHLTGDLSLLREELRPDQARLLEPEAGISDEQKAEGHELVAAALIRHRDAGCPPAPMPSDAQLRELIEFFTGPTTDEYRELLTEELALEGDPRAPAWHKAELAPDADFHVAIIGSGMSGIVAAHRLAQAGVAFTIFEKNDEVGGTWWENTYPGCRVDVPNHTYSYSFAQTGDWPQFFSTQEVLLDYFRTCAERFGLKERTRFGTEVARATFDDDTQTWSLDLRSADGGERHAARGAGAGKGEQAGPFHAVVSAVGQLNRPRWPDIPGQDRYEGQSFHSAQWDHSIDLTGKRVAVIGTGASAAQFIPAVAEEAAELVVFQRTPPWLIPTPNYQNELSEGLRWVIRHVPGYARWDRLWLFWRTLEGLHPMAAVDPEWPDQERSVSLLNDVIREMFTAYFQLEFPDPTLLEKVLPTYPPLSKRFVRDNGIWARTLTRENVTLVTDGIAEITEKGVRTEDGTEHVVDVLVYGTGFQASRFLTPMAVTGVGGVDLHEQWDGEARAYLGLTVPDFPNLFLMYGPNTNIVVNGSIIYFSECEAHYIVESVRMLLEAGRRSMDPRHDVHDEYNRRVDEANRNMAWGASTVNSWYKNASGRITQNWPFPLLDYWLQTREPDPDDYVLR